MTPEGWPRPIVKGWPIPWVSPPEDLAQMDPGRTEQILHKKLCQVCGLPHEPNSRVYFVASKPELKKEQEVYHAVSTMDNAVMHERCMRLATGKCPRLLALKRNRQIVLLSVAIENLHLFESDDNPEWLGALVEHIRDESSVIYGE